MKKIPPLWWNTISSTVTHHWWLIQTWRQDVWHKSRQSVFVSLPETLLF